MKNYRLVWDEFSADKRITTHIYFKKFKTADEARAEYNKNYEGMFSKANYAQIVKEVESLPLKGVA